jgi:hypothetical protein
MLPRKALDMLLHDCGEVAMSSSVLPAADQLYPHLHPACRSAGWLMISGGTTSRSSNSCPQQEVIENLHKNLPTVASSKTRNRQPQNTGRTNDANQLHIVLQLYCKLYCKFHRKCTANCRHLPGVRVQRHQQPCGGRAQGVS